MSEPILEPAYWKERLAATISNNRPLHQAIFRCPEKQWEAITEAHKQILANTIGPRDSILDIGCGWGRLLDILPPRWDGTYCGVDISPDFIALAKKCKPHYEQCFWCMDIRDYHVHGKYDWAVLISIRPMVIRNLGREVWEAMEKRIKQLTRHILYLEYDPKDEGVVC